MSQVSIFTGMATWPPLGADTTTSPEEEEWSWTEPPHPASPPATAPAKTLLTTCTLACVQGGKIKLLYSLFSLFGGHAPYIFYFAIFMWYHGNLAKYQACGDASSPQWTDVPGTFLLSASRLYINQLNTGTMRWVVCPQADLGNRLQDYASF